MPLVSDIALALPLCLIAASQYATLWACGTWFYFPLEHIVFSFGVKFSPSLGGEEGFKPRGDMLRT